MCHGCRVGSNEVVGLQGYFVYFVGIPSNSHGL